MYRAYAGIGSRETPTRVLKLMTGLAEWYAGKNLILRSGGAKGADSAFERGCDNAKGMKEIYLPWKGFNKNESPLHSVSNEAFEMAKHYHPNWVMCGRAARMFHARNCYQVLGPTLDTPSEFIVCWTLGGAMKGGTAQALRIAKDYNIEINNLGKRQTLSEFEEILERINKE